jgi:nicotinamidase-related amidase
MVHDPYWDLVHEPAEPVFDAQKTALLIIDMQNLCAHKDGWMGRLGADNGKPDHLQERFDFIDEVTPNQQAILNHARKIGVEVFHVRIGFRTNSTRDGKRELLNRKETPVVSWDYDIVDTLKPLEDEIVLNKTSVSTFNSTSIDQILRNMRRDRIWIMGVVTEGCVELTARDAADRGYYVTLVTDACASSRHTAHDDAVQRMTDGAVIRGYTADDLIARSEGAAVADRKLVA